MGIVNTLGLHEALFRAIQKQDQVWYSGAGEKRFASVTQLLKPPGMVALEKLHDHEIVDEAMDRMWMLMGSAMHRVIELSDDSEDSEAFTETRFVAEIAGKKITGGVDYIRFRPCSTRRCTITDFKFTSVYAYIFGDRIPEWEAQLNMYAHLSRLDDFPHMITHLEVCLIFRDWSASKAAHDVNYPRAQSIVLPVKRWSPAKAAAYMREHINALDAALQEGAEIEECSFDERWEKDTVYAIMKEKRKSAVRLLDSQDRAERWLDANPQKGKISIVERLGERTRCKSYCRVSKFCPHYQAYLREKENG